MTVASLWKALDRAECGKAFGAEGLLDPQRLKQVTTPWNFNNRPRQQHPTLAIDLSIWICESLSSTAMAENHTDPTLHLVFTRTLKLLTLGVKLVAVIEGKRRLRVDGEKDEFQKRRSGTRFWFACRRCEEMLGLLGVPVVRAKAEGEALCALLNQKGIVDGVISSDGDCFLFGAKVIFTKFSIENLNEGKVMRYDADELVACLDDDDNDEYDAKARQESALPSDVVSLNRIELIAFAILTGSDVAGSGLPKVGCRKALRFIRKCQIDNPLRSETAAFDELVSWAKAAHATSRTIYVGTSKRKCSLCCHKGTKSSHAKHGCLQCGTCPGEPCFQLSPGGKFRKSMQAKALAMEPRFDPEMVAKVYQSPNDDQIPLVFVGKTSSDVLMKTPDLQGFLNSSLMIRGRSYAESRGFVLQALSRLLARSELSSLYKSANPRKTPRPRVSLSSKKNQPVPTKVVKALTRSAIASFEIRWMIKATTTDSEGNPIDEFEFSTIEAQSIVKKCYPDLVDKFIMNEKERLKQGKAEQERRMAFLESMAKDDSRVSDKGLLVANHKSSKGGREFFDRKVNSRASNKVYPVASNINAAKRNLNSRPMLASYNDIGDDAARLLQEVTGGKPRPTISRQNDTEDRDRESIDTISTLSTGSIQLGESFILAAHTQPLGTTKENSPYKFILSPGHLHFLGTSRPPTVKSEQMMRPQQELNKHDASLQWVAGFFGPRENEVCKPEALSGNAPIVPTARSPDLFDRSPYLKRSRVTSTPPTRTTPSTLLQFVDGQNQMMLECSPTADLMPHREPGLSLRHQLCFESLVTEREGKFENSVVERNVGYHVQSNCEHARSSFMPSRVYHQRDLHNSQERFPGCFEEGVADTITNRLPPVDVDDSLFAHSFAGVSIHSIHSPLQMTRARMSSGDRLYNPEEPVLQRAQPVGADGHWLTPAFFSRHYRPEFHELSSDEQPRRNLDVDGYDIVETALAKWEHKSQLAQRNDENRQFLEGAVVYELDYGNTFGET